jgi:hypothetical protein
MILTNGHSSLKIEKYAGSTWKLRMGSLNPSRTLINLDIPVGNIPYVHPL